MSSSFTDGETEAGRGEVFIKIETGLCYLWDRTTHLSPLHLLSSSQINFSAPCTCRQPSPPPATSYLRTFAHAVPTTWKEGLLPFLRSVLGFNVISSKRLPLNTKQERPCLTALFYPLDNPLHRLKLSSLLVYLVYYLSGTEVGQLWAMGQILPVG